MTATELTEPTAELTAGQVTVLEMRADQAAPDELVASAREVRALVRMLHERHVIAVEAAAKDARVRSLATDWTHDLDIQRVAHGRMLLAALDGLDVRDLI